MNMSRVKWVVEPGEIIDRGHHPYISKNLVKKTPAKTKKKKFKSLMAII